MANSLSKLGQRGSSHRIVTSDRLRGVRAKINMLKLTWLPWQQDDWRHIAMAAYSTAI